MEAGRVTVCARPAGSAQSNAVVCNDKLASQLNPQLNPQKLHNPDSQLIGFRKLDCRATTQPPSQLEPCPGPGHWFMPDRLPLARLSANHSIGPNLKALQRCSTPSTLRSARPPPRKRTPPMAAPRPATPNLAVPLHLSPKVGTFIPAEYLGLHGQWGACSLPPYPPREGHILQEQERRARARIAPPHQEGPSAQGPQAPANARTARARPAPHRSTADDRQRRSSGVPSPRGAGDRRSPVAGLALFFLPLRK